MNTDNNSSFTDSESFSAVEKSLIVEAITPHNARPKLLNRTISSAIDRVAAVMPMLEKMDIGDLLLGLFVILHRRLLANRHKFRITQVITALAILAKWYLYDTESLFLQDQGSEEAELRRVRQRRFQQRKRYLLTEGDSLPI